MSGYLNRIVQAAAGSSRQQLRPLAGSVFGVPAEQEPTSHLNNTPFAIDDVEPASPSEAPSTQPPAIANRFARNPSPNARVENYQPLQPLQQPLSQSIQQPAQESFTSFESSSTSSRGQQQSAEILPPSGSLAANEREFIPEITERVEVSASRRTSGLAKSGSDSSGSIRDGQETIRSEDSAWPIASHPNQAAAPPSLIPAQPAAMFRAQQPPLRDQRSQPTQQPGVEIHIGRIEVLAVPPPAAPAPAPRRDRTTSLADYLAGRNGRRS